MSDWIIGCNNDRDVDKNIYIDLAFTAQECNNNNTVGKEGRTIHGIS